LKICQGKNALGYATVFRVCLATEKNRASLAGTDHLACCNVDQVFVVGVNFGAAQFAALDDSALLYESSQDGEGRVRISNFGLRISNF
jgi:hypothetical protein